QQVVDLAAFGKGRQGVEGITGIAVAGAQAAAVGLHQGLGEQSTGAAEGVGGWGGGLVYLALQPAMLEQVVENPAGLRAVVPEAALVFSLAVEQGRPFQRLAEDIQYLFAFD